MKLESVALSGPVTAVLGLDEEEQRVVVGMSKESYNNSSKPLGLHLIHCPGWSLETTTNKASSYSG